MTRIILHIGDKVTHTTLGKGVVTIVDEEFVTIKFVSDELTFRLPDAFEKGFLSSKDAVIIPDEEDVEEEIKQEEELDEEDLVKTHVSVKNDTSVSQVTSKQKKRGLINVAVFWLVLFVPVIAFLFWIPDEACNITGWIMIPLYFIFVLISNRIGRKTAEGGKKHSIRTQQDGQASLDPLTKLELGLMGSEILNNVIEREKLASEKRRYDSLYWQESIRDKNPRHDFDYDHMDD